MLAHLSIVGHQVREYVVGVYMAQPILHPQLYVCIHVATGGAEGQCRIVTRNLSKYVQQHRR